MERRRASALEHDAMRTVVGVLIAARQPDQGQARELLMPFLQELGGDDVMIPAFMFVAQALAEMAAEARGETGEDVLRQLAVDLAEPPDIGPVPKASE